MTTDTEEATAGSVTDDPIALPRALAEEFRPAVVERLGSPPTEELAPIRETGLVNLHIPIEFGGGGGSWHQLSCAVLELSRVDPNVGSLVAYHDHKFIPPFLDPIGDAAAIQRKSAARRWLWGHLSGPLDGFTAVPQPDGRFVVSGYKHQNTGPATGDVTTLSAFRTDRREAVSAYVPTDREGITFDAGWDHSGLRGTATQSISFDHVIVEADEVLRNSTGRPLHTLLPLLSHQRQPGVRCDLGRRRPGGSGTDPRVPPDRAGPASRPCRCRRRVRSGAPGHPDAPSAPAGLQPANANGAPNKDVPMLTRLGQVWGELKVADAQLRETPRAIDAVWQTRPDIDAADIDALTLSAAQTRAYSQQVALSVTQSVYDISGTSATASTHGFDRHWRDVRTVAQHDPVAHLLRATGEQYPAGTPIRALKFV